jgi:hypothetical protein
MQKIKQSIKIAFCKIMERKVNMPKGGIEWNALPRKNDSCFILGTAPSISGIDLSFINNEDVFLVNRGYLLNKQGLDCCRYYVISDKKAFESYGNELLNASFENFISIGDIRIPIDKINAKTLSFLAMYNNGTENRLDHGFVQDNIMQPLSNSSTVVLSAVQIAIILGYKNIYILGVDNDYSNKNNHFYLDTTEEKKHFETYTPPIDKNSSAFKKINRYAISKGSNLTNITPGNKLKVLPYISLGEFLKKRE